MQFSSHLCTISPEHVEILAIFGKGMAAAFLVSVLFQKAYYRRVILREDEPVAYWVTVASYGILAVFVLGGLVLCPLR